MSMNVLLTRLVGPMQSWGVQSRFSVRDTGLEPSKSGVVGLICAALGRGRAEPIDDLAGLRMGVRIDQEGQVLSDFHTAQNVLRAGGGIKPTEVSRRYYLADACFLVGLESSNEALLVAVHEALRNPHWSLYLGRKAFVPGQPVWLPHGLHLGEDLETALAGFPWLGSRKHAYPDRVRMVVEDPDGPATRPDQPLSFAERRFAPRRVKTVFIPAPPLPQEEAQCISHA